MGRRSTAAKTRRALTELNRANAYKTGFVVREYAAIPDADDAREESRALDITATRLLAFVPTRDRYSGVTWDVWRAPRALADTGPLSGRAGAAYDQLRAYLTNHPRGALVIAQISVAPDAAGAESLLEHPQLKPGAFDDPDATRLEAR